MTESKKFENRECKACDNGEGLCFHSPSSIVGELFPVHYPSGWVCMKYVSQKMYDFYLGQKAAKEATK